MNQRIILNMEKTGQKIRMFIAESGYTYEAVAESLGFTSPRVIYDWINGFKLPSIKNLVNLSIIFNVKLEDILFVENVF